MAADHRDGQEPAPDGRREEPRPDPRRHLVGPARREDGSPGRSKRRGQADRGPADADGDGRQGRRDRGMGARGGRPGPPDRRGADSRHVGSVGGRTRDRQPIWTGITRRRPTSAQRRFVEARNPTCVFPGCTRPAVGCHLDHTVPYSENGATALHNLGPLCGRHHLRAKHRAGWKVVQTPPGAFEWTSPRGHTYTVRPPPT